ncbi:MAG TPA: DUF2934 domain-containing protein [Rhizomicrobium sp.]|nr:DUF2934 domain-containing protein [Rhizomicrobium sp.]
MLDATQASRFEEWIRARSYRIWEREGRPDGRAEEHWLRAEKEIEAEWHCALDGAGARLVPPHPAIAKPPIHRISARFEMEPRRRAA